VSEPQSAKQPTSAQIEVEELGACKRRLTVSVPKDTIQAEVAHTFDELMTSAAVPGFRRGRVPRRLVEARFAEAVRDQVKEQLITRSYEEAVAQHHLEPVGTPDIQDVEFDPEVQLKYRVTLEVRPAFAVEGYEGLELVKPPVAVSDEEAGQALERLREREAYYEPVEGAVFGEGCLAIVDCTVTVDGEPYIKREQAELPAGTGNWLRMLSDDVGGPLLGKTKGAEVTFSTVIRPDFPDATKQGKVAEVWVKFAEVRERRLPAADDEFARRLKAENLEDLKMQIRRELTRQKEADADAVVRRQLTDALLAKFAVELPEELLREHAEDVGRRQRLELQYRGIPLAEVDKHAGELAEASAKQAARDFKLLFILEKIAEKEKVFATEQDVENEVALLAANYRVRPPRMRAELERRRMLGELRVRIRERKTIDLLLSKATIKEGAAAPGAGSEAPASAPAAEAGEESQSDKAAGE
jgi:trigger factor